ncbi:MAG: ABC transporter ATP-binding protein [Candidatus Dormibacteria bacterium]
MRGVNHSYGAAAAPLRVLRGVNLHVPAGGYVALTGRSGAGKSTLLSLVGGLESPTEGSIEVGGHLVGRLRGSALADYRRDTVGFVFQHFGLMEALTALENVELALTLSRQRSSERRGRAAALLAAVGLGDRLDHRPRALSGGERQRVAIARAMANGPRLLLADEPTGNLDEEASALVLDVLENMREEHSCTLVIVTHNRQVARRAAAQYRVVDGVVVRE